MAEFINNAVQNVAVGSNVLFADTVYPPCKKVIHREGSGIFTLKGGRYYVSFGANIAGATAGTQLDLAITLNGEELPATRMAITPATATVANNVSRTTEIEIPCCCCVTLGVKNVGTTDVTVYNAGLVLRREDIA